MRFYEALGINEVLWNFEAEVEANKNGIEAI